MHHVLPVNRRMVRMTEFVKLPITRETMLRSAPRAHRWQNEQKTNHKYSASKATPPAPV